MAEGLTDDAARLLDAVKRGSNRRDDLLHATGLSEDAFDLAAQELFANGLATPVAIGVDADDDLDGVKTIYLAGPFGRH